MHMHMVEDVVRGAGYLTLGTRLKRLGERLQAHTQCILDEHDLAIPASQYPFLLAIHQLGPLTVGEIAQAVGVTQPAATRTVAQLAEAGFVEVSQSSEDQRRKSIALAPRGKRLIDVGRRSVWPTIEGAVKDLCKGLSGPLLQQLEAIEEGLAERPLSQRTGKVRKRRR